MTTIEIDRTYPHPRERVWRALTDPELLARWLMPNDFENGAGGSEAEVWILSGSGKAVATNGEYGVRGAHITTYYTSNYTSNAAEQAEGNAYTNAHEFMHHLWDLLDEYQGASCQMIGMGDCGFAVCCTCGNSDCEPSPGSSTASFCLLDNYYLRGGNLDNPDQDDFTLNELCVASNHDPDTDTGQHCVHGESCWEVIASHPTRALTPPAGLPADGPPAIPAPSFPSLKPVSRFALCVDRSSSMGTPDAGFGETRLARAQQAAEIFANLTEVGDWLGVTSFSCSTKVNFDLTEVQGAGTKNDATTAIYALAEGGNTAIGRGLAESRDLLLEKDPACNQPIVLITDGFGNCGPSELSLIESLIENRIATTTVAIGADPQQDHLIEIAQRTGGKFYWVETAEDLPGLSAVLYADASGKGLISVAEGEVPGPQTILETSSVDVGTEEVTFVLSWTNPAVDFSLSLNSPGGGFINAASAFLNPNVDFFSGVGHRILRLRGAAVASGDWQVLVTPAGGAGPTGYQVAAIADVQETALTASTDRPQYGPGDSIFVRATPRYRGIPLSPAAVTASVVRPNGVVESLTLLDGGDGAEGDSVMGDGTYSARLAAATSPGAYTFRVEASGGATKTLPGEPLFASVGHVDTILPVPPFERTAVATAVVGSAPCGFTPYGEGLTPAHSLQLIGLGGTWVGSVALLETFGVTTGSALGGASLAPAHLPLFDGVLLVDLASLIQLQLLPAPGGAALWNVPIPNNSALIGLALYFQTLATSSAQPQGWAFSNGLRLVICPGPNG